jgi:hypothetical protein
MTPTPHPLSAEELAETCVHGTVGGGCALCIADAPMVAMQARIAHLEAALAEARAHNSDLIDQLCIAIDLLEGETLDVFIRKTGGDPVEFLASANRARDAALAEYRAKQENP